MNNSTIRPADLDLVADIAEIEAETFGPASPLELAVEVAAGFAPAEWAELRDRGYSHVEIDLLVTEARYVEEARRMDDALAVALESATVYCTAAAGLAPCRREALEGTDVCAAHAWSHHWTAHTAHLARKAAGKI